MAIVIKADEEHTYFEVKATVEDKEFERLKKEFPYLFNIQKETKMSYEEMIKDKELFCLSCSKKLSKIVLTTGIHDEDCVWNHYIKCNDCGYQNNLAKFLKKGCSCKEANKNE